MKLEDQVAPFELARKMRQLGFPQNEGGELVSGRPPRSYFVWIARTNTDTAHLYPYVDAATSGDEYLVAAYTVAELGEWLPITMNMDRIDYEMTAQKRPGKWAAGFFEGYRTECEWLFENEATTEAAARSHLLIALAESGALDPKGLR